MIYSATKQLLLTEARKISCIRNWLDSRDIHIHREVFKEKTAKIKIKGGGTIEIDRDTEILDGVLIYTYGGNIKIGKNCSINPYTIIYGHGGVTICNDVLIAGHCMIIPGNHNYSNLEHPICKQGNTNRGILIEDDVWVGHGCSILDGVKIGRGSVIAAGSVVNKSVASFSVVGGVPAKVIKSRK